MPAPPAAGPEPGETFEGCGGESVAVGVLVGVRVGVLVGVRLGVRVEVGTASEVDVNVGV